MKKFENIFCITVLISCAIFIVITQGGTTDSLEKLGAHTLEFFKLLKSNEYSSDKEHNGGLVVLNVNKRILDENGMRKLYKRFKKEKNLMAKNPSEVKTLLFIEEIPEHHSTYEGGIYIDKAQSGDPLFDLYNRGNSLDVYKVTLKATLIDAGTQKIISTKSFPRPEPLYPKKIELFVKKGNYYIVHSDEGDSVQFVYVLFNNNIPIGISSGFGTKILPDKLLSWIKSLYDAK